MGCFIHVAVEAKKRIIPGKREIWCNVDHYKINPYYTHQKDYKHYLKMYGLDKARESNLYPLDQKYLKVPVFESDNCILFATLSNICNHGEHAVPSLGFEKRGFPKNDADLPTREEFESFGSDADAPGFCTLKELKEGRRTLREMNTEGLKVSTKSDCAIRNWLGGWYPALDGSVLDGFISALERRKYEVLHSDDAEWDDCIRAIFWYTFSCKRLLEKGENGPSQLRGG